MMITTTFSSTTTTTTTTATAIKIETAAAVAAISTKEKTTETVSKEFDYVHFKYLNDSPKTSMSKDEKNTLLVGADMSETTYTRSSFNAVNNNTTNGEDVEYDSQLGKQQKVSHDLLKKKLHKEPWFCKNCKHFNYFKILDCESCSTTNTLDQKGKSINTLHGSSSVTSSMTPVLLSSKT